MHDNENATFCLSWLYIPLRVDYNFEWLPF